MKIYSEALTETEINICGLLEKEINSQLPGALHKIRHSHPVWFFEGNPIAVYSKKRHTVNVMEQVGFFKNKHCKEQRQALLEKLSRRNYLKLSGFCIRFPETAFAR